MGIAVLLFSGCRISFDEFRISGRVTEADGGKGIPAIIHYQRNYSSWRQINTDSWGNWSIGANENDRLTIWVEKENYMFQPAPYKLTVKGNRNDVNFKLIGWSDDFSTKNGEWYEGKLSNVPGDDSEAKYIFGADFDEYEMYLDNKPSTYASSAKSMAPFTIPSSYTVKVTGYRMDNPINGIGMYGLVFNVNSLAPGNSYYVFRVNTEAGSYELVKMKILSDNTIDPETIFEGNPSIIAPVTNILEVRQNYNKVELLINNEKVYEGYILEGVNDFIQVGLHAYADPNSAYKVRFDDFHVTATGIGPQMQMMNMMAGETISLKDIELK